jgi:hypothetical protein
MDVKEYVEKGSLAIVVTASALYLSGMEYYLSLFHKVGTGVFFVVPMEYALYEGIAPLRGVIVVAVLCGMLGYFARKEARQSKTSIWLVRCALAMVCLALAGLMPLLAERFLDVPSTQIVGAVWKLFGWGVPCCLLSFWIMAIPPVTPVARRLLVFWMILFGILWGYFYSSQLGESFALVIAKKQKSRILFSDESLQKQYGASLFHPMMEKGDDLILLRFPLQNSDDHKVVFVKRCLIKGIELQ